MRLSELTKVLGGRLLGEKDDVVKNITSVAYAGPGELSLIAWPKDIRFAKKSLATCIIMSTCWAAEYADQITSNIIAVDNLNIIFSKLFELVNNNILNQDYSYKKNIHPHAYVSAQAFVGQAQIGAHSYVSPQAFIGDNILIGHNSYVGPGAVILDKTRIGNYVHIGAHTVIGSPAFSPYSNNNDELTMLCSLGSVHIENNIHIGSLCSVDKGLLGPTRLENFCKLDNHVHVGHDAWLKAKVAIAAQTGLAGFVQIGEGASIGGQAGVCPHVIIGAHARVGAKTLVHKNLKAFEICSGNPGLPHERYLRAYKNNMVKKSGFNYGL